MNEQDDGMVELCAAGDVAPGCARRVLVGAQPLAVFNVAGQYHVTDDTCTHGFSSLSTGEIDGCTVVCGWHGGAFDVRTGQAVRPPCTEPIRVYRCTVRDGQVQADLFEPIAGPGA